MTLRAVANLSSGPLLLMWEPPLRGDQVPRQWRRKDRLLHSRKMIRFLFKFIICLLLAAAVGVGLLALRSGDPFYTLL